jgi:hypothetical protein
LDDEILFNDSDYDDELSDNLNDESVSSKKSNVQISKPSNKITRRKDPLHKTNRFKFSLAEDEIIKTQILEKIFGGPTNSATTII